MECYNRQVKTFKFFGKEGNTALKKRKNRLLALLLILGFIMGEFSGLPSARAAETKKVYRGEGYEITVEEQSSWQDGSVAEVVVANTGSRTIRNWKILSWFSGGTVVNAWNAEWAETDETITFSCQEFNRSIEPGEKITFGCQMDRGHLGDLDKMKLVQGKYQENQPEEYSVSYRIADQWDRHAVIEAEIYNHTDHLIDDWQLSFQYNAKITNIWNAKILDSRSGTYELANMDYNARIPAGEKISFGFEAEFPGEEITCPEESRIQSAGDEKVSEGITPVTPGVETGDEEDFDPETDAYVYHDIENQDWNMEMINADSDIVKKALEHPRGAVRVALLDSGVNYSDEVYVSARKNFVPGEDEYSPLYEDVSGHGTAVAEVLASNPGGTPISVDEYGAEEEQYSDFETEDLKCEGEDDERLAGEEEASGSSLFQVLDSGYEWNQGVNPTVDLISAKVLDENNETTVEQVVQAIDWAIEMDSDIISMSFGMKEDSEKLHRAVRRAHRAGLLLVAAAGNDGETEYPAAYKEVMSVGAVDSVARQPEGSAGGKDVEVVAPGEFILSRGAFDSMQIFSGTSMAVPHVVGLASILWQKDTSRTAGFIRSLIGATARECGTSGEYGHGLIDCEYALEHYDEFAALYQEEESSDGPDLTQEGMENGEEIDTDAGVRSLYGSWGGKEHQAFVTKNVKKDGKYKGKWENLDKEVKILKIGAVLADSKKNPDCRGMHAHPWFHGYYGEKKWNKETEEQEVESNYLAGYYYLYTLAEGMYSGGRMNLQQDMTASVFQNNEELKNAYEGINHAFEDPDKIGSLEWGKISSYCQDKKAKKERSLLLMGMALHTLTDTYAHSTFCRDNTKKKSIKWSAIAHKKTDKNTGKKRADSTKYYDRRYKNAKKAASALMKRIRVSADKGFTGFKPGKNCLAVYGAPSYYDITKHIKTTKSGDRFIQMKYFKEAYAIGRGDDYPQQLYGLKDLDAGVLRDVSSRLQCISLTYVSQKTKGFQVIKNMPRKGIKSAVGKLYSSRTGELLGTVPSEKGGFEFCVSKDSELRFTVAQKESGNRFCSIISGGRVYTESGRSIPRLTYGEEEEQEENTQVMCGIYPFEYDLSKLSYRVELTWEDPSLDLDSLLIVDFPSIPDDKTGYYFYMTYFVEKTFRPELGDVFQKDDRAEIVKDVKDGSGPEVTKIYELEEGGYYSFSVRNYSGKSQELLSRSGAKVKLYKGDEKTPMYTCSVPEGKGYYWEAFILLGDSGILLPYNRLTYDVRGYEE